MNTESKMMANHWWWRPGWSVGRRFYAWHLTFHGQPDVHRLVGAYRNVLADLPGLDLIPDEWLHCTMQGVGFCDEIAESDVAALVDAVRARLADVAAFQVRFDAPVITPEAIESFAVPPEPVAAVRNAIRFAIGGILPEVPEPTDGFHPHVSVAYSKASGPAEPFRKALASIHIASATARIAAVDLIVMHRDNRMYEWETYTRIPLQ